MENRGMKSGELESRAHRIAALGYDYAAQPNTFVESCNLCGSDDWVLITHLDRYGFQAPATTCRRCGLTQLNPRMTREAYGRFYTSIYRPLVSAYHGRLIDSVTIQIEQREYAERMGRFVESLLDRSDNPKMLDVGGSTGVVASYFAARFGLDALVIDPAPAEAAVATSLGIRTELGFVEEWNTDERFGLIGMFQTIDHLLDISRTLAQLRSIIDSRGKLVVDIVDFRAAYLRHWCVEEAIKIDHPFYLTEATAEAFFRRHGFEVVRSCYAADHLHIAYICRPCEPDPSYLPPRRDAGRMLREIRFVQNARRPLP